MHLNARFLCNLLPSDIQNSGKKLSEVMQTAYIIKSFVERMRLIMGDLSEDRVRIVLRGWS